MNRKIIDIEKHLFEEALSSSTSYREALSKLAISYCSATITQVRVAAQKYNIDISHLETKKSKPVDDAKKRLESKWEKRNLINKKLRQGSIEDYAIFTLYDSRNNDKKHNRKNDLNIDFVKEKLSIGKCYYCEDTNIKLTFDRINNNLGHTQDNVVVSCIMCNLIKNNMPYEAWLHIVPSIKSAKDLGMFDNWKPFGREC